MMRWPFVSRDRFDAAERHSNEWRDMARDVLNQRDQDHRHYDVLLEQFMKLRMAGAVEPVVLTPPPPREVDELKELCALKAAGDVRLYARMLKQLREDRVTMTDDEIARRIVSGQSTDDGVPS